LLNGVKQTARASPRLTIVRQRESAAFARRLAAHDRRRVEMTQVDEHRPLARGRHRIVRTDRREVGLDARGGGARREDARVADHHEMRRGACFVERDQLGRELGADPRGIAHRHGDDGAGVVRCVQRNSP
jgi:hypothetical protein